MRECPTCSRIEDDATVTCPDDGLGLIPSRSGSPVVAGKYRVIRLLGEGGMGVVFLAHHLMIDRQVALKFIRSRSSPTVSFIRRFEQEALTLGRLKHPHIVDVFDYGVDDQDGATPFLVLEYLEGTALTSYCGPRSPLSMGERLALLQQIADALDFAHSRGIIHRDLKPSNVLVRQEESGSSAKILDFGLARLTDVAEDPEADAFPRSCAREDVTVRQRLSPTGSQRFAGTPPYMAPELFAGVDASPSTDIYAFGVLTYELLTGRRPLDVRSWGELTTPRKIVPPSRQEPSVPIAADDVLLRCLSANPAERPHSAGALVEELQDALRRAHLHDWFRREAPRRTLLSIAIALVCIAATPLLDRVAPLAVANYALSDMQMRIAARSGTADSRVATVVFDEESLGDDTPLASRSEDFAALIETLFSAGAATVAIDLLLPAAWSRSESFTKAILRHHDRIVLAASVDREKVVGPESIAAPARHVLQEKNFTRLFGFVNVAADRDGVVRQAELSVPTASGARFASFAARSVEAFDPAALRHAEQLLPEQRFFVDFDAPPPIPVREIAKRISRDRDLVANRLVFIGGTYIASGDTFTTARRSISGVELQASAAATLLSGNPARLLRSRAQHWLALIISIVAASAVLMSTRARALRIIVAAVVVLGAATLYLNVVHRLIVSVVTIGAVLLLALICATVFRLQLSPRPPGGRP